MSGSIEGWDRDQVAENRGASPLRCDGLGPPRRSFRNLLLFRDERNGSIH
jgi:hypothetical protein